MKAEQKWKNGQGKLQKKVKKSVGLGICVFFDAATCLTASL